jgi:hypothetical protein
MRRRSVSTLSSSGSFELTRPSTTILSLGMKRRGSKPPARSVSYSSKKRSTLSWENARSATGS